MVLPDIFTILKLMLKNVLPFGGLLIVVASGMSIGTRRSGTPAGIVTHKLYINRNLVWSQDASWSAAAVSAFLGNALVYFNQSIPVPPGSLISATQALSDGDSYTNYLYTSYILDTHSSFPAELTPLLRKAVAGGVSFNGSTWVEHTGNSIGGGFSCGLLLDGDTPFGSPSINRRQFNNQR